jgi:hypothetical protein
MRTEEEHPELYQMRQLLSVAFAMLRVSFELLQLLVFSFREQKLRRKPNKETINERTEQGVVAVCHKKTAPL